MAVRTRGLPIVNAAPKFTPGSPMAIGTNRIVRGRVDVGTLVTVLDILMTVDARKPGMGWRRSGELGVAVRAVEILGNGLRRLHG